jgi:uncharacterized membrane protein HdeD (DUF308 family)
MLLGSWILIDDPESGFYIIAAFLSFSLTVYGIKSLIYYFTMARNMVGGKTIFYKALIMVDLGIFTITAINIPKIYLVCHLLITYGFSGLVDMLRAVEDKKLGAPSWKMSFLYGLGNLLVAVTALRCIRNQSSWMVVYIYSAGLAYSAVMQMISSFRKTAIVYIQ